MDAIEALRARQPEIQSIAAKHGAGNVRIFGSVARGEAHPEKRCRFSDRRRGPTTPWFPGGLLVDLENLLHRRVDLVIARSLHPLIRESVLKDAVPL